MAHEDERNVMLIKFSIFINNEFSINPRKRKITEIDIESFLSTLPEEKEEKSNPICPKLKACISESGIQCPKYDVICPI
jgi:hypothetical protein